MSPIDASNLQVDAREEERCRHVLQVTVPADQISVVREKVTERYLSRAKLKGFRKGRVPPNVLMKRFGTAIERDTLDKVLGDSVDAAIKSSELRPIDKVSVDEVEYVGENDLSFKASFEVLPTVAVKRLGGFKLERPAVRLPDNGVERALEQLRRSNATWKPSAEGKAQAGDRVKVEIARIDATPSDDTATDDSSEDEEGPIARGYTIELGRGEALPDIESAIQQLDVGSENNFEVTFPEDFPDEKRRGKSHNLNIRLVERNVPDLPELDDSFAKSLGDFDSLEALKGRIKKQLEAEAESQADRDVRHQLVQGLVDAHPFPLPNSLVDACTDSMIENVKDLDEEVVQKVRDEMRDRSTRLVRQDLLLAKIVEEHNLAASEDEIDSQVEAIAEQAGLPPERVYADLQKSGKLSGVERELTEAKLFTFLLGQSEVTQAT